MAIISRRQYDHPALATAGGSALHASISNLYTVLGDDSMSRYKTFTAVANSSVGVIAHEFGLDFANLKVQIFTGTYPALTLVSDPIGTGWTVAATSGLASRSIDITAPASGGPHTYAVLVSHESNATAFIPGLVSIGAQIFAGPKTFSSTIVGSISGNAATVTTNANLTGEATSSGSNAVTLTNSAVIGKVLTGYVSGAGTVAATDSILQAFQKINGNDALKAPLASPTFTGTITAEDLTLNSTNSFLQMSDNTKRLWISGGTGDGVGTAGPLIELAGSGSGDNGILAFVGSDQSARWSTNPSIQFYTYASSTITNLTGQITGAGAWTFGSADAADISHIIAGAGITSRKPIQWGASALTSGRAASISTVGTATNGDKLIFANNTTVGEAKLLHGDSSTVGFIGLAAGGTGVAAGDIHTSWHSGSASSTYATIGKVTFAGAWTLGAASGSQTHTVNGNNISLVGSNSFYRLGTAGGYLGQADGPGSFFTGTIGGDTLLVGQGNLWLTAGAPSSISSYMRLKITSTPTIDFLSTSNAVLGTVNSSGAWTLGPPAGLADSHLIRRSAGSGAILTVNQVDTGSARNNTIEFQQNSVSQYAIGQLLNDSLNFRFYAGTTSGTILGEFTNAGAWTFPTNTVHLFGNTTTVTDCQVQIKTEGTKNAYLSFFSGTSRSYIGVGPAGGLVTSSTAGDLQIANTDTAKGISFGVGTGVALCGRISNTGAWSLGTTASDTGIHSINTNRANDTLDVINAHSSTPYGARLRFTGASPDNNTSYFLLAADSTTTRCVIYSDGDLQNHDNSYAGISDERLKQDIIPSTSQIDDFKAIKFKKYRFKSDVEADPNAGYQLGVIAQEIQQTSPGLVTYNEDTDTFGVQYSILYLKACVALQETIAKVDALEARLAALES